MRTVDLREQEIFLQAIEIDSAIKRKDFICQACGDNENLRKRIEDLLELQDTGSFILDKNVSLDAEGNISTDPEGVADLTGSTISGKYHLVRKIGSGGMGDVYLAEQRAPIRRRVAVKIVKLGMDTQVFISRFNTERQALALMDHPGITRVFDAGSTKTGRPYFVMELVSGQSITQFCDEKRLSIAERIQIFIRLCKAIQHAHQKGIIHRDLKPSNILVIEKDGKYFPKVIDFGVSKATLSESPAADLTRATCMLGTPDYMSPEQADTQGNDQDIRTDIYSLGAILFELMTGSTPFELEDLKSKSLLTVREIIQTRAVDPPSRRVHQLEDTKPQVFRDRQLEVQTLSSELAGNLDAIILKCLNKDRSTRYASVAELARDLSRHANGELLELVKRTWGSVWFQMAKRHTRSFMAAALSVGLVLGVLIFCIVFAIQAHRSHERVLEAQELANQQLKELQRAHREIQDERIRANRSKENYLAQIAEKDENEVWLRAIARFNKKDFALAESDINYFISSWLRITIPQSLRNYLPNTRLATEQDTENGDIYFLELLLDEQQPGVADETVAQTLDWLGKAHANAEDYQRAIHYWQRSLDLRVDDPTKAAERVQSALYMTDALIEIRNFEDAESKLNMIDRLLDQITDDQKRERSRQYRDDLQRRLQNSR